MGRKPKVSPTLKIQAVQEYLSGKDSKNSIAQRYGVTLKPFQRWLDLYEAFGSEAFGNVHKNISYPATLKEMVAIAYLNGEGSFAEVAKKYKIRSETQVARWVLKYNSHEELKASGIGGVPIMTKGRKTTYDERIEIVKYCIEHQNNFAETAQHFRVSYYQVYSWNNKYEKDGVEALKDRRGRNRTESEMSELEKLKAQNKLLEAKNRRKQMEIEFLKKLDEIERGRF